MLRYLALPPPSRTVPAGPYDGAVILYGNAFSPDSGRCFRWVYWEGTTQPMHCPGEIVTRGWWQDRGGVWWVVDACLDHAGQVGIGRPVPGSRIGGGPKERFRSLEGRTPRTSPGRPEAFRKPSADAAA